MLAGISCEFVVDDYNACFGRSHVDDLFTIDRPRGSYEFAYNVMNEEISAQPGE